MGRRQPPHQVLNVYFPVLDDPAERKVASQPGVGNQFNDAVDYVWRDPPGHHRIHLSERVGELQQDMVFYKGEWVPAPSEMVVPSVMEIERGAMINEPESPMPDQHVRVARRSVNICHIRVEPNDRRGEIRVGTLRHRIKRYGTWQIVKREIEAVARPDQVLYLRIGLGAGEFGVEFDKDDFRHWQPRRAGDLPGH